MDSLLVALKCTVLLTGKEKSDYDDYDDDDDDNEFTLDHRDSYLSTHGIITL